MPSRGVHAGAVRALEVAWGGRMRARSKAGVLASGASCVKGTRRG
jgi:hypothetical protein